MLVLAVTYRRTSVPEEGRAGTVKGRPRFCSSGSFVTTVVVANVEGSPIPKVDGVRPVVRSKVVCHWLWCR